MDERPAAIVRSIAREEALRASGGDARPPTAADLLPVVVEQTLQAICARPEFLSDGEVRRYLLARSQAASYHVATRLLDLVLPLHDLGHEQEAIACLRKLARLDEPESWNPEGNDLRGLLAGKIFGEILGSERLVGNRPGTWGALAIDAFGALLGARWSGSSWTSASGPTIPSGTRRGGSPGN